MTPAWTYFKMEQKHIKVKQERRYAYFSKCYNGPTQGRIYIWAIMGCSPGPQD